MKHVFFVHSPITYLVSKEIIKQKKLDRKNCILLSTHDYFKKLPFQENDFGDLRLIQDNIVDNNHPIKKGFLIDKLIQKMVKVRFYFYTAHDLFLPVKFFIFHNLCIKYYYLEEGMASYNSLLWGTFKNARVINHRISEISPYFKNIIRKSPFNFKFNCIALKTKALKFIPENLFNYSEKLAGGFTFSEHGFPFPISKYILHRPQDKKIFDINEDIPILVYDNMVNSKLCTLETLKKVTNEVLEHHKILYIKFHPVQKTSERNELVSIIKNANSQVFILPDKLLLEEIFVNRSLKIFGFFSSLLFYNILFSNKKGSSFSLINKIISIEGKEFDRKYYETINFLKENNVIFL